MKSNSKKRTCEYNICVVEEISQKGIYVKKFIILCIGYFYLISVPSAFTFFTIALYVSPMFIDNSSAILKALNHGPMIIINGITKFVNIIIIVGCISGVSGFLVDEGDAISVTSTALIGAGAYSQKYVIAIILFMNIVEVVIMMIFMPGKNDSALLKKFRGLEGEKEVPC